MPSARADPAQTPGPARRPARPPRSRTGRRGSGRASFTSLYSVATDARQRSFSTWDSMLADTPTRLPSSRNESPSSRRRARRRGPAAACMAPAPSTVRPEGAAAPRRSSALYCTPGVGRGLRQAGSRSAEPPQPGRGAPAPTPSGPAPRTSLNTCKEILDAFGAPPVSRGRRPPSEGAAPGGSRGRAHQVGTAVILGGTSGIGREPRRAVGGRRHVRRHLGPGRRAGPGRGRGDRPRRPRHRRRPRGPGDHRRRPLRHRERRPPRGRRDRARRERHQGVRRRPRDAPGDAQAGRLRRGRARAARALHAQRLDRAVRRPRHDAPVPRLDHGHHRERRHQLDGANPSRTSLRRSA